MIARADQHMGLGRAQENANRTTANLSMMRLHGMSRSNQYVLLAARTQDCRDKRESSRCMLPSNNSAATLGMHCQD